MHVYATDEDRRVFLFILFAVSVGLGYVTHVLVGAFSAVPPWYVDLPTPFVVFGLLYKLVDLRGWRWSWIRWLGLVKVPDLGGRWTVEMKSSYDDFRTLYAANATIRQTWTRISISISAERSSSYSFSGSLLLDTPSGAELSYLYQNRPNPEAVGTMSIHYGTTMVHYDPDRPNEMDGDYYTGRGRTTYGSIKFLRKN